MSGIGMVIVGILAGFGAMALVFVIFFFLDECEHNARRKAELKRRCQNCGATYMVFTDRYCRRCGEKLK